MAVQSGAIVGCSIVGIQKDLESKVKTRDTRGYRIKNGKWEGLGGFGAVEVDPPVDDRLRNYSPWYYTSSAYA